jgi:hypothetical protein
VNLALCVQDFAAIRDGALTFFVMLNMAVLVEDAALLVLYRNTWIVPWRVSSSEQMPN